MSTLRITRRSLVALPAAAALCLAGCAAQGGGAADDGAGGEPAADGQAGGQAAADGSEGEEGAAGQAASDDDAAAASPVRKTTFAFNTLVTVTAYGVDEDVVRGCLDACQAYENLFSARRSGTDIDRVNKAAGEPVEVDPDTADLLRLALRYGDETGGAFDVTIGSVSLLWDFMNAVKPADEDIAEGLRHVDYRQVEVDGTAVRMGDPLARIDLGGVGKGWVAARLAERLEGAGCASALIDLGTSSIYALGARPDGAPWRVGLRDPKGSATDILGVVQAEDGAVTTSGLYDQEFELDGRTYWHILDPATGYPAETDMLGVTLLGADPAECDALSTALFTMGIEGGAAWLAENRPEVAAMFVGEDDEPVFANGFEERGYAPLEADGE